MPIDDGLSPATTAGGNETDSDGDTKWITKVKFAAGAGLLLAAIIVALIIFVIILKRRKREREGNKYYIIMYIQIFVEMLRHRKVGVLPECLMFDVTTEYSESAPKYAYSKTSSGKKRIFFRIYRPFLTVFSSGLNFPVRVVSRDLHQVTQAVT